MPVLALYPAGDRPSTRLEPLGNAGGLSGSRLWRYRAGSRILVARAWPADGPPRAALEAIHGWLAEAGPLGFVPVPRVALDGRTCPAHSGRLWEVAPWLAGEAELPGAVPTAGRVRAAFAALAAFHQRLGHRRLTGPSAGLNARLREVDWLLGGGFAAFERAVHDRPADPAAGPARRWLDAARNAAPRVQEALARAAGAPVVRQPCLRDVRPGHFLFTGEVVTGLVDYGAMGLETVAADLARLLAEWLGPAPDLRNAGLDAYSSVRPIDPSETALIAGFERSAALLGPGHWVRWHFLEGRTFEDPVAVVRGIEKGLERLEGG